MLNCPDSDYDCGCAYYPEDFEPWFDDPWKKSMNLSILNEEEQLDTYVSDEISYSIYPNPTYGEFVIDLFGTNHVNSIEIINTFGQMIEKRNNLDTHIEFSINQEPGLYFLRIYSDSYTFYYNSYGKYRFINENLIELESDSINGYISINTLLLEIVNENEVIFKTTSFFATSPLYDTIAILKYTSKYISVSCPKEALEFELPVE